MKALSVKSPHAQRIALGQKTMEIRSKRTHYRGPLLICVSKGRDEETKRQRDAGNATSSLRLSISPSLQLSYGHAICIVDVVGCRQMMPGDEADACHRFVKGYFVWKLANVRVVRPFAVKGRLGFFEVSDELIVERRRDGETQRRRDEVSNSPQFTSSPGHKKIGSPSTRSEFPPSLTRAIRVPPSLKCVRADLPLPWKPADCDPWALTEGDP